jgi:hypothetical protein
MALLCGAPSHADARSSHIAIMSEFRVKPPRSAIPMSSTSTAPPAPPTP